MEAMAVRVLDILSAALYNSTVVVAVARAVLPKALVVLAVAVTVVLDIQVVLDFQEYLTQEAVVVVAQMAQAAQAD
jgi:hypothetical protein